MMLTVWQAIRIGQIAAQHDEAAYNIRELGSAIVVDVWRGGRFVYSERIPVVP